MELCPIMSVLYKRVARYASVSSVGDYRGHSIPANMNAGFPYLVRYIMTT